MRPPSSGGIGKRLKIARTTLRSRAFLRFAANHCAPGAGANDMKGESGDLLLSAEGSAIHLGLSSNSFNMGAIRSMNC